MWRLAVRDLQWRRRRFLIAVASTGLVFAITLILAGMTTGLENEPARAVKLVNADAWVVSAGTTGPYTASRLLPLSAVDQVAASPGVTLAQPLVLGHAAAPIDGALVDTNVIGHIPGGMGTPNVTKGTGVGQDGQVVVDDTASVHLGDIITIASTPLTVVGITHHTSFNFGIVTIFMTVGDAQRIAFAGQPLISSVVTKGVPTTLPPELTAVDSAHVADDLHRPIVRGLTTIQSVSIMLWAVAAGIVGSIVYLTALERTRDFAVLKATGASNGALFASLAVQALVLTGASIVAATVLAYFLEGTFDVPVEIGPHAYLGLLALGLVVATIASAFGLRRAVSVDPALAFGG